MAETGVVAGGRLTDWISLGVLASWVPADAVDDAIEAAGRGAKRKGGKPPPRVMAYFAMAMALFADEDYEEVAARLADWGGWEESWDRTPTSGGITQARQRLGATPLEELFRQVAAPVANLGTRGAFLGPWRLMSIDGMEWYVPDTPANREAFGIHDAGGGEAAYPKARLVTVSEWRLACACAGGDGPGGRRKGQRGAVPGQGPVPALGGGLAADRGPELLLLGRLGGGGGYRGGAAVAGEIRHPAAGPGTAARRVLPVSAGEPCGQGQEAGSTD